MISYKNYILELLHAYKSEVDNFNDAIFEDKFEALADDILKLQLNDSSRERHFLISFMEYYNNRTEMYKLGINEFEIDDYLNNR